MHIENQEEALFKCETDSFQSIPYIGTPVGHEEQGQDPVVTLRP